MDILERAGGRVMPNFEPLPHYDDPDPDGCVCPQDYVASGCPVHDNERDTPPTQGAVDPCCEALRAMLREAVEYPGPYTPPGWGRRARALLDETK